MPGNSKPRKKSAPRRRRVKNTEVVNGEAAPGLPTSGQILGVLVRSLGITHPHLGDKTAQRFFSGRLRDRVMESSRTRIIDAVSENMAAALFANPTAGDDEEDASSPSGLSLLLEWHAATWDQFRAFLRAQGAACLPGKHGPGLESLHQTRRHRPGPPRRCPSPHCRGVSGLTGIPRVRQCWPQGGVSQRETGWRRNPLD